MRLSDSTTSPLCGICPPTRPVLPPCGTIAVEVSLAILRSSETSSVEPGRSTTGVWPVHSARNSTRYGACLSWIGDGVLLADDGDEAREQWRAKRR